MLKLNYKKEEVASESKIGFNRHTNTQMLSHEIGLYNPVAVYTRCEYPFPSTPTTFSLPTRCSLRSWYHHARHRHLHRRDYVASLKEYEVCESKVAQAARVASPSRYDVPVSQSCCRPISLSSFTCHRAVASRSAYFWQTARVRMLLATSTIPSSLAPSFFLF